MLLVPRTVRAKLLQQVGPLRSYCGFEPMDTDALAAARVANLAQFLADVIEGDLPRHRLQLTVRLADKWLGVMRVSLLAKSKA